MPERTEARIGATRDSATLNAHKVCSLPQHAHRLQLTGSDFLGFAAGEAGEDSTFAALHVADAGEVATGDAAGADAGAAFGGLTCRPSVVALESSGHPSLSTLCTTSSVHAAPSSAPNRPPPSPPPPPPKVSVDAGAAC